MPPAPGRGWSTRSIPVGAGDEEIVAAYARACSSRTRLVVVDRITSPTATVVPVAAVAAAVGIAAAGADVRVLVDAAHAPGQLDDDIGALGADHWIGNLHKWAYTPRGSAILWSRPGADVTPTVLSWQLEDGYAESFDYPGTWDYAGWLAVGEGLAYWDGLGGWDAVSELAGLAAEGQKKVAEALDVSLDRLPVTPAPTMRLVPLPDGVLAAADQVDPFYEDLSQRRIEAAPSTSTGPATCASRRRRTTPLTTTTGWPAPCGSCWAGAAPAGPGVSGRWR